MVRASSLHRARDWRQSVDIRRVVRVDNGWLSDGEVPMQMIRVLTGLLVLMLIASVNYWYVFPFVLIAGMVLTSIGQWTIGMPLIVVSVIVLAVETWCWFDSILRGNGD